MLYMYTIFEFTPNVNATNYNSICHVIVSDISKGQQI